MKLDQLRLEDLEQVTGGWGRLAQAFAQNHPIATGVLRRLWNGPAARQGGGTCPGGNCGGSGGE